MTNVGGLDRTLRFVLGAVLLALPFLAPWGSWKYVLAALGLGMLATAVFRFCPAYTLIGVTTCRLRKS